MAKNILEFCLSPDLGGLELFMLNCYKSFKKQTNCKIMVQEGKKLDSYLENENVDYLKRNKLFPIIPAFKLAKYIDDNDIDVIHFHWTKDINVVVLAKVLSKKEPQIIQTRNMTMTRFKDDFYHKWLYKNINTMHAVTYQVKEQIEKFIPSDICPKVNMVYMGTEEKEIDHNKIQLLKKKYNLQDEFVVGIVGRIEEGKGQYLVIEAIEKLKHFNIKALIVGHTMDEEYLNSLKQKIKDLGIEDKVIFTGFTKEVDEHMQLFDVNILATPKETFGLVVIEAMINKVCMIATNAGGPLEIIDDGKDGLLFDRTSDDLAKKIQTLYNDKNSLDTISLAGQVKAKREFDNTTQLNKLYKVINES
ncbi:glycosyltransferase family 4 protein [Arcobacteraceae bacterium]|nr:glycosyltransferase family 4 protein [Arcobacteraceae bacterium]